MTEGLIDDKHVGFRAGRRCVDQILTLKQIGEKAQEKIHRIHSECFRINSGVRQGCIISPWLFNVYVDTVMMEGKKGVRLQEEGTEWRLPSLLNANDLGLCGGSEEDLRVMVGHFAEVCRRGLKVNAGKNKVISVRWGRGVIV